MSSTQEGLFSLEPATLSVFPLSPAPHLWIDRQAGHLPVRVTSRNVQLTPCDAYGFVCVCVCVWSA